LAAAANPERRIQRIVLSTETAPGLAPRLAALGEGRRAKLPAPEVLAREQIDRLLPRGAVHQGIGLCADELEAPDLEDVIRAADGENGARVIVLDQVTDPHNVGAILRSAAAFDAAAVILPERHAPGTSGVMAKAASGALERVPLVRVVNVARTLARLKQAGFWCVGLDGGASAALAEADLTGKLALVLGAEGEGLRRLTREHCDLMVRIPIARGADSLNVSNAAAVALYEIARRG
jgi:23S rRNA (guanosine2251-2'-O)-methyltransferase